MSPTGASGLVAAAHQVHFLPWLRYVHKALAAEVFVLLDDVQFVKGDWHNRNRLKGPGGPHSLTVPVRHRLGQRLDEVEIVRSSPWRRKHLTSMRTSYGRAPYFQQVFPLIEEVYAARDWERLTDFSLALLQALFPLCGVRARLVTSSSLDIPGRGTERLIALCRSVGAGCYLSGAYATSQYLNVQALKEAGLTPLFQLWKPPRYEQVHPAAGFAGDLAIVDLLMAAGPETGRLLLAAGGTTALVPAT